MKFLKIHLYIVYNSFSATIELSSCKNLKTVTPQLFIENVSLPQIPFMYVFSVVHA